MSLKVISAGFGRTGTMSLKLALEQLLGAPCHHMEEVVKNGPDQVPLWNDAVDGKADWDAIYNGFSSAVDWPTAAFWRDVHAAFPEAKMILSTRSAESWWKSFSNTILPSLLDERGPPPHLKDWIEMVKKVVIGRSLGGKTDKDGAITAFEAHEAAVKTAYPEGQLLVHEAKDGWEPLCAFLGVPVPDTPYPRTNSTDEFHELMKSFVEGPQ